MNFKKYTDKYKAIFKKYKGIDISDEAALEGTIKLFNFARAISKAIRKEDLDRFLLKDKNSVQMI